MCKAATFLQEPILLQCQQVAVQLVQCNRRRPLAIRLALYGRVTTDRPGYDLPWKLCGCVYCATRSCRGSPRDSGPVSHNMFPHCGARITGYLPGTSISAPSHLAIRCGPSPYSFLLYWHPEPGHSTNSVFQLAVWVFVRGPELLSRSDRSHPTSPEFSFDKTNWQANAQTLYVGPYHHHNPHGGNNHDDTATVLQKCRKSLADPVAASAYIR